MHLNHRYLFFALAIIIGSGICCESEPNKAKTTHSFIADHNVANQQILRSIPESFISQARNNLHIAYQHTSHGTHVAYGLFGLQNFKEGDDVLFGITNHNPEPDKLDFRDNAMASYAADGQDASDLSRNETAFIQATRNYLDDPENAEINVVMWSWCNIAGHAVAENYLPGMQQLINEYARGGSKIGQSEGMRKNPVTFIFMTGHANAGSNLGDGNPKEQASLIIDFCRRNNQYCLDYYGIDTHDMDGNYWDDAGDDGNSEKYGGNFYRDWQDSHQQGVDYFENRNTPGGEVRYGAHNSQHITANRKAYAMWYILASIMGYSGN